MRVSVLVLAVLAGACASSGGADRPDPYAPLLADELMEVGDRDLESTIRVLRPRWMTLSRSSTDVTRPGRISVCRGSLLVYVNGRRSQRSLAHYKANEVERVEVIRPGRSRPDGYRGCETLAGVHITTG